ncbi:hypothetical protein BH23ACT11_BH23ACT11_19730 [soil metagenome]
MCARAENNCPKTFPGVNARISWLFDDPRGKDVPEDWMLEAFRSVRDEIEQKILAWINNPEAELAKLKEERERQRKERLETERKAAMELPGQEAFTNGVCAGGHDPASVPTLQPC